MKRNLVYSGLLATCLFGCIKTEQVSTIPEITFESYNLELFQDKLGNTSLVGVLKFSFIDGDANIGVPEDVFNDTLLPDSIRYNVFMTAFEKTNQTYFPIVPDTSKVFPKLVYAIWKNDKLSRSGQNKTIKGDITIKMTDMPPDYDTIRFDFYIIDRDGNHSNIESTTDIGLK